MTKQYRKQNGLIVPDESLALPDIKPQPWYTGRLSANRFMSRRKCCCGTSCPCSGILPNELYVRITGAVERSPAQCCAGGNCAIFWNSTFILTKKSECCYGYTSETWPCLCCDEDEWTNTSIEACYVHGFQSGWDSYTNYALTVDITECRCTSTTTDTCMRGIGAAWYYDFGSSPHACVFSGEITMSGNGSGIMCDLTTASGTTCYVSCA